MRILLTGAGGFLGGILRNCLMGHRLTTLGRDTRSDIRADITSPMGGLSGFDLVIHAAGKAHSVPVTDRERAEFHEVNHKGTLHLLEALGRSGNPPGSIVLISTVSVYGLEQGLSIDEGAPLNGNSPYAVSKIRAEQAAEEWGARHGTNVLILRLPLILGRDAPGNLGHMVRHMRRGTYLRIGSGEARRSMVLGVDVARQIMRSTEASGTFNLTDGYHPSISELDTHMARQLGTRVYGVPEGLARIMARMGDFIPGAPIDSRRFDKLNNSLTFSDDKAVGALDWSPTPVLQSDFLKD